VPVLQKDFCNTIRQKQPFDGRFLIF